MGSPRKFAYVLYSLIKASIFSLSQPFVCFDLLSECWLFWQSTFFQIVERSNVLVLFFPRLRLALWRFVTHHAMWPQLCRCCLFQKPPRHGPLRVRAWRLGIPAPGMLPPQQTPLQNSPACSLGHYHYHQASLSHPKTMQIVPWVGHFNNILYYSQWENKMPLQNSPDCSLGQYYYHQTSLSHPKTAQIVPWDVINIITIWYPSHPKTVYTRYINSIKGTSSTKAKLSKCGA